MFQVLDVSWGFLVGKSYRRVTMPKRIARRTLLKVSASDVLAGVACRTNLGWAGLDNGEYFIVHKLA